MFVGIDIRLVGFNVGHAGRIEILNKGVWGVVVQNKVGAIFGYTESKVACRELGYHDIQKVLTVQDFPQIESPVHHKVIWLSEVACKGNESRLLECGHKPYTVNNVYGTSGVLCKHSKFSITE